MLALVAELALLLGICALIYLTAFGFAYAEKRQTRQTRSTASGDVLPSVSRSHMSHLVGAESSSIPPASKKFEQGPVKNLPTGISQQSFTGDAADQAEFTPAQTERLLAYRAAYRRGDFQPDPLVQKRLAFARWLYQHGKITG